MPGVELCTTCERWVNVTHDVGAARSVRLAAARLVCRAWPEHRSRANAKKRARTTCACNADGKCLAHSAPA